MNEPAETPVDPETIPFSSEETAEFRQLDRAVQAAFIEVGRLELERRLHEQQCVAAGQKAVEAVRKRDARARDFAISHGVDKLKTKYTVTEADGALVFQKTSA